MAKFFEIGKGDLRIVIALHLVRAPRWTIAYRGQRMAEGIGMASMVDRGWIVVEALEMNNQTGPAGDLRALLISAEDSLLRA